MAAILRDSTVVVAVVRTRPRAIPLSMINHEKIHTWVSFSYMVMGLRLAALRAAGAPLLILDSLKQFYNPFKKLLRQFYPCFNIVYDILRCNQNASN